MYYVYILTNKMYTTLYVGITNNLIRRMYEHKNKIFQGFTSKYNLDKLVYFEQTSSPNSAIEREKTLKKWARNKKLFLINQMNPEWKDLSLDLS